MVYKSNTNSITIQPNQTYTIYDEGYTKGIINIKTQYIDHLHPHTVKIDGSPITYDSTGYVSSWKGYFTTITVESGSGGVDGILPYQILYLD